MSSNHKNTESVKIDINKSYHKWIFLLLTCLVFAGFLYFYLF